MKILFEYFSQAKICSSASQAVEFINSLHCRNNPKCAPLVVNKRVLELLESLFEKEWNTDGPGFPYILVETRTATCYDRHEYYDGFKLRTTNCSNTSIKGYYPLADTVEGHNAELLRRQEEKRAKQKREREAYFMKRYAELSETRKGWYSVSLTYERMKINSMRMVESTFSGKCIADSGLDAYRKLIAEIEKDGEASFNAIYPDAKSPCYEFVYLGVKTDDGYTYKEWEDEQ